jgi:RNase P/RNase MRP subunit p29
MNNSPALNQYRILKLAVILTAAMQFSACTTVKLTDFHRDGLIDISKSEFDGATEQRLNASPLRDLKIKVGALKTSRMKADDFVLTVEIPTAVNIADKRALKVNIDGDILVFDPADQVTAIRAGSQSAVYGNVQPHSSRDFLATKSDLKRIVSAKRAIFRVELLNGKHVEDALEVPPNWPKNELKAAAEALPAFLKAAFQ